MIRRRKLLWALAAACAVTAAVAVGVRVYLPPWLRSAIERKAGEVLGREFRISGSFDLSLWPDPMIVAEDVLLANAPWGNGPFLARASRVRVSLDLRSLRSPPIRILDVELEGVRIGFETDASSRRNWDLGDVSGHSPPRAARSPVVVERAAIRDLEWSFVTAQGAAPRRVGVARLEARLDAASGMIDLDARGHFNDVPWDVAGRLGTLDRLYELRDVESEVSGHLGGVKLGVRGRIRDPLALSGPNLVAEIEGEEIAAALATVGLESPLAGPFRVRGRFSPSGEEVGIELTAEVAEVRAEVRGRSGTLLEPDPIDVEVALAGPDASLVGRWAQVEGLPSGPFEVTGRVRRDGSRLRIDGARVRAAGTTVFASGTIAAAPRGVGTDLEVAASGKDLSELSALTRVRLPAGKFALRGRFLRRADALAVEEVEIRTQSATARWSGTIGEPPLLDRLDLTFDASGSDLSRFSGLATIELPRESFALRGSVSRAGDGFDLEEVEGSLGGHAFGVSGRLASAPRLAGSDLRVRVEGPDLQHAASLAGLPGFPPVPYGVAGRVRIVPEGFGLEGGEARAGRIAARADGLLGARPLEDGTVLDARVEGPDLSDLSAWGLGAPLPADPFVVSGRLFVEGSALRLDRATAEVGSDRLAVRGVLGEPPDLSAADVAVEVSGPSLSDLGRFFGSEHGEPPRWLPEEPYEISGRFRRAPSGVEIAGARVNVGDAEIRLDGRVGSGKGLRGTDLRFEARARDSSLAERLAGIALPAGPIEILGRLERVERGFRLEGVTASVGEAHGRVSGVLGEPPDFAGTDLDLGVEGPDLAAALEPITGLSPLPSLPFEVSARVAGNVDGFDSSGLTARLGESDLEGSVKVRLDGRPSIEADVRSKRLGVPDFLTGLPEEPLDLAAAPEPAKRKDRERDRLIIPDERLDLEGLRSFDARLRLTVAESAIPGATLRDVSLEAEVYDGALHIDRIEGTGERGGHAKGRLLLAPFESGYRLEASGRLEGGRIGLGPATESSSAPPFDIEFAIEGAGRSLHEIAAASDGHALVTIGPGRVERERSGFVTSGVARGLLDALNPFRKSSSHTEFECAVVSAGVEDGRMVAKPIAARTDKLTILGHGEVNFETEKIDLVWTLKPREGVGISAGSIANPYIKLGGTLGAPSLDAKPLEAVASTGAAVATAGLTVLFRGFYDRITAEKKVCKKALQEARRQAEERRAREVP